MTANNDDDKADLIYNKSNSKPKKEPWTLGGPGTKLPFVVESFFSWSIALGFLSISGYHYVRTIYILPAIERFSKLILLTASKHERGLPCWLELTTASRAELSDENRYDEQLVRYLQKTTQKMADWSPDELIASIRGSDIARRLVSMILKPNSCPKEESALHSQLIDVYPQLLKLTDVVSSETAAFDISIILPAYRERGTDVRSKLDRAYKVCKNPKRVEIIIVDAGGCIDLDIQLDDSLSSWGDLKILQFLTGGGRGPCLNFGASHAAGRHYSFLHADTTLPPAWDDKIVKALDEKKNGIRANSCAFSFGIDCTGKGLNGGPYPPGICAIETTANMRTQMYSLPYGDQCLSVPAVIFKYLGGFPDQCLMEDYELISLLRRRAALLPKFGITEKEQLVIIGGTPAYCSPRRWQKFGVLYVTFMNSRLVQAYASGKTPDWLFEQYYGRPPPERASSKAPWELDLEQLID